MSKSVVSPEKEFNRMHSRDLIFNSLAQTFTTGHNESIIEEVNDYSYLQRMFGDTRLNNLRMWAVIFVVAFGTSIIAAAIDISAYNIGYYKKTFCQGLENKYFGFLAWTVISIVFVCIGTSLGYFFNPDVDGSGIPEIKAIISGVELPRFLLWRTFFLKALGLVCCSASLSIGREGPHIHLAAIIAHKCLKIPTFKSIGKFKAFCTQIFQASVTAGVAAVMGTPLGATFFSIEITASYYVVHTLISSIACGVICSVILNVYHSIYLTEDFSHSKDYIDYNYIDLALVSVLGICCGVLGVAFIKTAKTFTRLRARRTILFLHKRFRYAIFVAIVYSTASFFIPTLSYTAKSVFNELISEKELHRDWSDRTVINLLIYSFCKPFVTALSISVQIPFGIFLPVLDSGAAFGRAFGYLANYLGGSAHASFYAAIGGASLVASSTHALSAALIIFELTGEIRYVVPMMLSVVISCQIAKNFELNIYDVTIQTRNIPFLPAVRKDILYQHCAREIMEPVVSLCVHSTLRDIKPCLQYEDGFKIPIVDLNMYIVAETSARRIKKYLEYSIETFTIDAKQGVKQEIKLWMNHQEYSPPSIATFLGQEMDCFLASPVDFTSRYFSLNRDPLSVAESTNLSKIHYIFHMLGLMKIFITQHSKLVGIINRESFTAYNK